MATTSWPTDGVEATSPPYRRMMGAGQTGKPIPPMETMPLSTQFFAEPRVLDAGPVAALCYLGSYLWVSKHGTDRITAGAIGALFDWSQLGVTAAEAAERCVVCGLMERITNGYRLLSYKSDGAR
jgi:hypothetical protein